MGGESTASVERVRNAAFAQSAGEALTGISGESFVFTEAAKEAVSVLLPPPGYSLEEVSKVQQVVSEIARTQTLSLIDLALPTLREMTLEQYQRFERCVQKLILADDDIDLREWVIQRVVLQHLNEQYGLRKKPIEKYFILGSAKYPGELILSMLAYLEHSDEEEVLRAFDNAKRSVGAGALRLLPKADVSVDGLNAAIDELELLKPPIKKRFLQACVTCISHDGKVTIQAYELTRAIASCLDCPMPPIVTHRQH